MKRSLLAYLGVVGGMVSAAFGGWDGAMATLIGLMAADYVSGVLVAGLFHHSDKTASGRLSSNVGFLGLRKKGVMLLLVLVGARLDAFLGLQFVRNSVAIGFMANELLSLVENAARMGIPIPEAIRQALDLLNKKQ